MARVLLRPATLIVIAANLVPLVGVIAWDWDAFLLLMLYWLETAVMAFWTVVRIALTPRAERGDLKFDGSGRPASPIGMAAFFTLHAGIFMGVHFMFLWTLFAGAWARRIHGPRDFAIQIVVDSGLWLPLLLLFLMRGLLLLLDLFEPALRRLFRLAPPRPAQTTLSPTESVLFGLYGRIVVMQLTIILGGWFALMVGTAGAYVLLIALKTALDVAFTVFPAAIEAKWRKAKADARQSQS